jgi:hypothetical protein
MSYELGQIIYVLSNKTQSVVPAVIEEEFVHKKLNGNVINYKVSIGPPGRKKIVDLEKIDGEVFVSLDDIRNTLTERLTGFVNDLVNSTEERAKAWYGGQNSAPTADVKMSGDKIDPQTFLEQAATPTAQPKPLPAPRSADPRQAMRDQLRTLVAGPEENLPENVEEAEFVDGNGKVRKVTINLNGNG